MANSRAVEQVFAGIGKIIAGLSLVAAVALLMAWVFMWLWNGAVVEALTVAKPIEYWTAFWLTFFLGIFVRAKSSAK